MEPITQLSPGRYRTQAIVSASFRDTSGGEGCYQQDMDAALAAVDAAGSTCDVVAAVQIAPHHDPFVGHRYLLVTLEVEASGFSTASAEVKRWRDHASASAVTFHRANPSPVG